EYVDPRDAFDPYASAWGDTLTLNYEVNDFIHLKSITGYRSLTQHQSGQLGGSYVAGLYSTAGGLFNLRGQNVPLEYDTPTDYVTQDQESEEFQATGTIGEFNYVAGFFYFHEQVDEAQHTQIPLYSSLPAGSQIQDKFLNYAISSTSYAGYANFG